MRVACRVLVEDYTKICYLSAGRQTRLLVSDFDRREVVQILSGTKSDEREFVNLHL